MAASDAIALQVCPRGSAAVAELFVLVQLDYLDLHIYQFVW